MKVAVCEVEVALLAGREVLELDNPLKGYVEVAGEVVVEVCFRREGAC